METEMDIVAKKYGDLTKPIVEKSIEIITGKTVPTEA